MLSLAHHHGNLLAEWEDRGARAGGCILCAVGVGGILMRIPGNFSWGPQRRGCLASLAQQESGPTPRLDRNYMTSQGWAQPAGGSSHSNVTRVPQEEKEFLC